MYYFAIIPAAGIGSRIGHKTPKQYLKIDDMAILQHTINKIAQVKLIKTIIIPIHPNDDYFTSIKMPKNIQINPIIGGETRQESVFNALKYLDGYAQDNDWVLVHDAARPLVEVSDINQLIYKVKSHSVGGILANKITDTIKQSAGNSINATLDRSQIWRALTPQMFRFKILYSALERTPHYIVTDESEAVEKLGFKPLLIEGSDFNLKITTQADLKVAQMLFNSRNV